MYVRTTPGKPRKDGSKASYVQLAHNEWDPVKGRSTVRVVHNFGRADALDVEGLRRLAGSIARYLDRGGAGPVPEEPGGGLRLVSSRPMGAAHLLDGLWSRLGFADAIAAAVEGRRIDPGVERVLFPKFRSP